MVYPTFACIVTWPVFVRFLYRNIFALFVGKYESINRSRSIIWTVDETRWVAICKPNHRWRSSGASRVTSALSFINESSYRVVSFWYSWLNLHQPPHLINSFTRRPDGRNAWLESRELMLLWLQWHKSWPFLVGVFYCTTFLHAWRGVHLARIGESASSTRFLRRLLHRRGLAAFTGDSALHNWEGGLENHALL